MKEDSEARENADCGRFRGDAEIHPFRSEGAMQGEKEARSRHRKKKYTPDCEEGREWR